jgi:hypothetical protein
MRDRVYHIAVEPFAGGLPGPYRVLEDAAHEGARRLVVAVDRGTALHDVLAAIVGAGARLRSCDEVEPDLEQAFSRIVRAEAGAS